jgi:hypothetical protein
LEFALMTNLETKVEATLFSRGEIGELLSLGEDNLRLTICIGRIQAGFAGNIYIASSGVGIAGFN